MYQNARVELPWILIDENQFSMDPIDENQFPWIIIDGKLIPMDLHAILMDSHRWKIDSHRWENSWIIDGDPWDLNPGVQYIEIGLERVDSLFKPFNK